MLLENPFFTRELRALSRKRFMPYGVLLLLSAGLLVFPVWLTYAGPGTSPGEMQLRFSFALVVLLAAHASVCYAAGRNLGERVFAEEQRANTLELLRLVSMHPLRWLLLKLAFPAYFLLLVWLAPLPLYLGFVLRGYPYVYPRTLATPALLALCAGLAGLSAGLLAPPEAGRRMAELRKRLSPADVITNLARAGLGPWIAVVLCALGIDWLHGCYSGTPGFLEKRFFNTVLSTDRGLAVLVGSYLLGALLSAWSVADPVSRGAGRAASLARSLAVAVAYTLFLGYSWPGAASWSQALMVGIPVLFLVSGYTSERRKRRRPEDPWSALEVARLRSNSDNPVFIRDLRVTLRAASLLRQALGVWSQLMLVTLMFLAALGAIGLSLGRGLPVLSRLGIDDFVRVAAGTWTCIAYLMLIPALLGIGARAGRQWMGEWRQNTVGQLLQTPLSGEEVVRGRGAAALLLGAVRAAPLAGMFLVGTLLAGWWGQMVGWFLTLGWLLAAGLMLAAGAAGPGAGRPERGSKRVGAYTAAQGLSGLILVAEAVLFVALLIGLPELGLHRGDFFQTYAAATCCANLFFAWLIFHRSAADVERLRRTDLQ